MPDNAGVTCGQCGKPILRDEREGRQPCPHCGSLVRSFSMVMSGGIRVSGSADIKFIPYAEALIDSAQRWIDANEPSMAIIVLHTAVEVATSRVLSIGLRSKGMADLDEAIGHLVQSYNITNERIRKLYQAVTKDDVTKRPFWGDLVESARRRNGVVHRGERFRRQDAEGGLHAARDLVSHLLVVEKQFGTPWHAA
jgi:hypothetical protein